jgi:tetratricopeptide (TPR) repeat protein
VFLRQTLRKLPPKGPDEELFAALALGETYLALKDYPDAERHLFKALEVNKDGPYDFNWQTTLMVANVNLGKL